MTANNPEPNTVVDFEHVVKDYPAGVLGSGRLAVDDVSFSVRKGEVIGLLGPNRAGKTTLLKLLLSVCRPTGGRVYRLGRPLGDRSTLAQLGYVHENQAFPRYLTAHSLLDYYGAMTLTPPKERRERVPKLLERVGLADCAREPISRFSKGMVQRLGLAQALINDPELLVCDEPAEGLDQLGRVLFFDVVRELRDSGRTVVLVSHVLPDVERLCDRAAVLLYGKLAFLGSMAELTRDPSTGQQRSLENALHDMYRKSAAA